MILVSLQLRDFIHEQLYGEESGYFNQDESPIAPLDHPLDFKGFLGKADYLSAVDAAHKQLKVCYQETAPLLTFQWEYLRGCTNSGNSGSNEGTILHKR